MNPYGFDGNLYALHQHMDKLDAEQREDDELDAEIGLILDDPIRLGEACHDADPCMSIIDAATIEARKRLGVCA